MADFGYGQQGPSDTTCDYNIHSFLVNQLISRVRTCQLVKVLATGSNGSVVAPGWVNVQVLVNQVDGLGNSVPHGTIFNIPFARQQSGTNAVIMDPTVGDIGLMGVCDRDISSVKANKGQANPGSFRRYNLADGVYILGLFGAVPTQYVQFNSTGITVVSPTKVILQAPTIALNGAIVTNGVITDQSGTLNIASSINQTAGSIVSVGNITAGSIDLETHVHGGVSTGSHNTGAPTG
jgi:hypothetical protein